MSLKRHTILFILAAIGGCGGGAGGDASSLALETSLPGVYRGEFPCDGCDGIATTLWLRSDGRFFFEQEYPAVDGREAMRAYSLGRWDAVAGQRAIRLESVGPRRVFTHPDPDSLLMQTPSDLEHRLTRDPAAPQFSATVTMAGTMRPTETGMLFTECLTGLTAPVTSGGDFRRFRHQYRSATSEGASAFVEFEGHFTWSDDGAVASMTIDRFLTVRQDGGCRL